MILQTQQQMVKELTRDDKPQLFDESDLLTRGSFDGQVAFEPLPIVLVVNKGVAAEPEGC